MDSRAPRRGPKFHFRPEECRKADGAYLTFHNIELVEKFFSAADDRVNFARGALLLVGNSTLLRYDEDSAFLFVPYYNIFILNL